MKVGLQCKFVIVIIRNYANMPICKSASVSAREHLYIKENKIRKQASCPIQKIQWEMFIITMRYLVKSLKQALLQSVKKKQEIVVITNGWTNSLLSFYLQLETRKHFNMFWSTLCTALLSTIMAARGLWASKRHSWCCKAGPVKCTDCRLSICRLVVEFVK